ncbi:hypothetical protein RUM43_002413 [Polyplax serrata]|uniref:Uncharacterized protein n=1 Tax=Polyplax serrata TaxID=468196 RepID=A0AAN8RVW6_POLSC
MTTCVGEREAVKCQKKKTDTSDDADGCDVHKSNSAVRQATAAAEEVNRKLSGWSPCVHGHVRARNQQTNKKKRNWNAFRPEGPSINVKSSLATMGKGVSNVKTSPPSLRAQLYYATLQKRPFNEESDKVFNYLYPVTGD